MIKYIYRKLIGIVRPLQERRKYWAQWNVRISDVVNSADNDYIPRVKNAGKIIDNCQVMHNGLKIVTGSYYGNGITEMLKKNKGVHEPQEERVFQEVLKTLKKDATILELGAYWSFYSMWFLTQITNGRAFLFEPEMENLEYGLANFKLNNLKGDFNQAFIGKEYLDGETPTYSVDYIVEKKNIDFIDILHCDIQGFELEMLMGAKETIEDKKIGYLFISTHSNEVHKKCINYIHERGFKIISQCNLDQTCSVDGLIVARAEYYHGVGEINIAVNNI